LDLLVEIKVKIENRSTGDFIISIKFFSSWLVFADISGETSISSTIWIFILFQTLIKLIEIGRGDNDYSTILCPRLGIYPKFYLYSPSTTSIHTYLCFTACFFNDIGGMASDVCTKIAFDSVLSYWRVLKRLWFYFWPGENRLIYFLSSNWKTIKGSAGVFLTKSQNILELYDTRNFVLLL
jgi:hypothetical protein